MYSFIVDGTSRTPKIELDSQKQTLTISGESYPENAVEFYEKLQTALDQYFSHEPERLSVLVKLDYFNSGSAHALLKLARVLNEKAADHVLIDLCWHCHKDDDISEAFAADIITLAPKIGMKIEKIS